MKNPHFFLLVLKNLRSSRSILRWVQVKSLLVKSNDFQVEQYCSRKRHLKICWDLIFACHSDWSGTTSIQWMKALQCTGQSHTVKKGPIQNANSTPTEKHLTHRWKSIYHIQPSCFSPCPHQISIINVGILHWAEYGFKNLSQHSNPSMLCLSDLAWMTKSICHSCPYLFLLKTKEASLFLRWSLHLAPWSYSISLPWSSDCNREEKTWNVHDSPFSRLCLPGLTFKGIRLFIRVEIKSCRTENNIGLLEVYRNIVTWPMWTAGSTKDSGTKKFAPTSHTPSPFRIKEAWILTRVRWFFGTLVHHLLGLLASPIKLLFLAPTPRLLDFWPVMQWAVWTWTWSHDCSPRSSKTRALSATWPLWLGPCTVPTGLTINACLPALPLWRLAPGTVSELHPLVGKLRVAYWTSLEE